MSLSPASHHRTVLFHLFFFIFLISACSDTPKQYDASAPPKPDWSNEKLKVPNVVGAPSGLPGGAATAVSATAASGEALDELARRNSLEPIVYGEGAGGITFNTSYEEARKKLTAPRLAPQRISGMSAYPSGLLIAWKMVGEVATTPYVFALTKEYLGKLKIDDEISLGTSDRLTHLFPGSFGSDDPDGNELLNELYRKLEKISDDKFNCLDKGLCKNEGDDLLRKFSWKKITIVFSKDEKAVVQIALKKEAEPGLLHNPLDLITASIRSRGGFFGLGGKTIGIGSQWKDVTSLVKSEPHVIVAPDMFICDYGNVTISLTKSKHKADYLKPDPDEAIRGIAIDAQFTKPFQVFGKYLKLGFPAEGISVEGVDTLPPDSAVVEREPEGSTHKDRILQMNLNLPRSLQPTVARNIGLAIAEIAQKNDADFLKIPPLFSGFNDASIERAYTGQVVLVDPKHGRGHVIKYAMPSTTGSLSYLSIGLLHPQLDLHDFLAAVTTGHTQEIYAGAEKDFPKGKPRPLNPVLLTGHTLGEVALFERLELTRGEGDIAFLNSILGPKHEPQPIPVRPMLDETYEAVFEPHGKPEKVKVVYTQIGHELPVMLAFHPVSRKITDAKGEEQEALILGLLAITSTHNVGGVKGICGLDKLHVRPGMSETQFTKALSEAISEKQKTEPGFQCERIIKLENDSSNKLAQVTFPNERLQLVFNDGELQATSFYSKPSEVEKRIDSVIEAREKAIKAKGAKGK